MGDGAWTNWGGGYGKWRAKLTSNEETRVATPPNYPPWKEEDEQGWKYTEPGPSPGVGGGIAWQTEKTEPT